MIKIYHINTGSCGGCDIEIGAALASSTDLSLATTPQEADVLILTGPITAGSQRALSRLLSDASAVPLIVIGRCAIDGHPFGKGGMQELPDVAVRLQLEGCPPTLADITAAIREAITRAIDKQ
ncbi:MAG: NADH:ubiquinone oxidoreductase [Chloroflexales bacterium]|nr:NADH:ubiquinone oxidoreductase [Chloroflexales bacterium]